MKIILVDLDDEWIVSNCNDKSWLKDYKIYQILFFILFKICYLNI